MPKIDQILPISGPMDDSLDNEYLQSGQGQIRRRINMRPDALGNSMSNVGINGTLLLDAEYPDGDNSTIGWCNDNKNEAIIWFVHNSESNHCIYRIFTLTGIIQKVFFEEPTLGFTERTRISAEVIDGRLYWNDNTNQPKGFNLAKAVNYTNSLTGDAYVLLDKPFNEKIFPYIKKPPRFNPEVNYQSVAVIDEHEVVFNNLRKKLWQFKYTYVYEDFQESAYSPISAVPAPSGELFITGEWVSEITLNNAIKVTINTGNNNVKSIKIAVRDASNLNSDPFYVFKTVDKFNDDGSVIIPNDVSYDELFLNNTQLTSIDTQFGNAYFHDVPLAAKDLILLDGKYVSMSMPKSGYDYKETELSYTLSTRNAEVDFSSATVLMVKTVVFDNIKFPAICGRRAVPRTDVTIVTFTIPGNFLKNSSYQISVPRTDINSGISSSPTATYLSGDTEPGNYPKVARDSLVNQLVSIVDVCLFPNLTMTIEGDDKILIIYDGHAHGGLGSLSPTGKITTAVNSSSYKGLKRGQYHPFAVVYNDINGRYNVAFGQKELYAPLPDAVADPESLNSVVLPTISISSFPPVWAHTYRIAYIPYNSYTYTLFVPVVEQIEGTGVDDPENNIPTNKYFLKINQAVLRMIEETPNSSIGAYAWINGDRIRRWGYDKNFEILREYTRTYKVGDLDTTESGFLINDKIVEFKEGYIDNLEIYRPNLNPQDKIFYEISDEFAILNPGTDDRVHSGGISNQSLTGTAAVSDLDFGDIYYRQRLTGDIDLSLAPAEDNDYSDYYKSSGINIGRGVVRTDSKQAILYRTIKSENYIQNTELNRLNIFLAGSESYTVSEVYGEITRIIERGDTLKILQGHKETSVYIGKNYAKDGAGGDIILVTDRTFGSELPYPSFSGSLYPRAVNMFDNFVYFYDSMTGDLFRSASNGTESVTKLYGMSRYFDTKSKEFRDSSENKDVILSTEPSTGTLYLSWIIGKTIETIAFTENSMFKGFIFFAEFNNGENIPEELAFYGDNMYFFLDGKIYLHGAGPINEFFDSERKSALMEFVTNQAPEVQKSFETIALDTNGNWTAEMEVEADNNYPNGQKTKIFTKMFRDREGSLNSAVPRNLIKRNGDEDLQLLYSGNKMLGHAMKVSISSVNFDKLREVKVSSINQK